MFTRMTLARTCGAFTLLLPLASACFDNPFSGPPQETEEHGPASSTDGEGSAVGSTQQAATLVPTTPKPGPLTIGPARPWQGDLEGVRGLNPANGNYYRPFELVQLEQPTGWAVRVDAVYNSRAQTQGEFGRNWTLSVDARVIPGSGSATVSWGDGYQSGFTRQADGTYLGEPMEYDRLSYSSSDDSYSLTAASTGLEYRFTNAGGPYLLHTISDRNDNTVTLERDSSDRISRVLDALGRPIDIEYSGQYISVVRDPAGNEISFTRSGDHLSSISFPTHNSVTPTWTFSHSPEGYLLSETPPVANALYYSY